MKKTKLLNSELSYVVAKMGHFDTLAVGDAGFPVPDGVQRIDLAVTFGIPSFRETFYTLMEELAVQKATIAQEMRSQNPALYEELTAFFLEKGIAVEEVSHEVLKSNSAACKAVVRTGECRPYANVLLESDVAF